MEWMGRRLVGTTDSDYQQSLDEEPLIQPQEVAYLIAALEDQFPSLRLTLDDITATFSRVRPGDHKRRGESLSRKPGSCRLERKRASELARHAQSGRGKR
jgi:glycerol-3-phosphate dehydrogenase